MMMQYLGILMPLVVLSCVEDMLLLRIRMEEPMAQQLGQMGRETHLLARGTR